MREIAGEREGTSHFHSLLLNENDFVCLFVCLLHILHTSTQTLFRAHLYSQLIKPYYIQLKAIYSPTSHGENARGRHSRCNRKCAFPQQQMLIWHTVSVWHITFHKVKCTVVSVCLDGCGRCCLDCKQRIKINFL